MQRASCTTIAWSSSAHIQDPLSVDHVGRADGRQAAATTAARRPSVRHHREHVPHSTRVRAPGHVRSVIFIAARLSASTTAFCSTSSATTGTSVSARPPSWRARSHTIRWRSSVWARCLASSSSPPVIKRRARPLQRRRATCPRAYRRIFPAWFNWPNSGQNCRAAHDSTHVLILVHLSCYAGTTLDRDGALRPTNRIATTSTTAIYYVPLPVITSQVYRNCFMVYKHMTKHVFKCFQSSKMIFLRFCQKIILIFLRLWKCSIFLSGLTFKSEK